MLLRWALFVRHRCCVVQNLLQFSYHGRWFSAFGDSGLGTEIRNPPTATFQSPLNLVKLRKVGHIFIKYLKEFVLAGHLVFNNCTWNHRTTATHHAHSCFSPSRLRPHNPLHKHSRRSRIQLDAGAGHLMACRPNHD